MSTDEPKTPSADNVDGDAMKPEAEEVVQPQMAEDSVDQDVEAESEKNDENQTVVKPLSDLTTEDFRKLGLPVDGHDGLSDHVPDNVVENKISNIEQAFSCLLYTSPSPRDRG